MYIIPKDKKRLLYLLIIFVILNIILFGYFLIINFDYIFFAKKCPKEIKILKDGTIMCRRGAECSMQDCSDIIK